MQDYVERGTTVARTRVENAATTTTQEQEDIRQAENVGLTSRELKKCFRRFWLPSETV